MSEGVCLCVCLRVCIRVCASPDLDFLHHRDHLALCAYKCHAKMLHHIQHFEATIVCGVHNEKTMKMKMESTIITMNRIMMMKQNEHDNDNKSAVPEASSPGTSISA